MENSFGYQISAFVLGELETFRNGTAESLFVALSPFTRIFVTLYLVVVGYMVLMGKIGERAKSWALSMLFLALIQATVMEANSFNTWVFDPLMGVAFDSAMFFGGGPDGTFGRLDNAIGMVVASVDQLDPTGNLLTNTMAYIKVAVASMILLLMVTGMYLAYLALTLLAVLAMYLLMGLAPFFLFFSAFPETRFLAKTWFRTFCQYALWMVLLASVMAIAIPGIEAAADSLANWDVVRDGVFTKQYGMTLLFTGVVIYFLLKTSDLSAALTGGVGMQAGLVGGMLGAGMGAMGSAANAGGSGFMGAMRAGAGNLAAIGAYGAGRAAGAGAQGVVRAYSALKGIHYPS